MKLKVAVSGLLGRMGQEVKQKLESRTDVELAFGLDCAKFESAQKSGGVPCFSSVDQINVDCDVVIDFSSPENTIALAQWCAKNKKPLVTGTTGFDHEPEEIFKPFSSQCAILWSANMSIGIASLRESISSFSRLKDYDIKIEEVHHKHKKDSPSGTAKVLHKDLQNKLKISVETPLSLRGGGVFGIHKIYFFGEDEVLTLEHVALNRSVFARGAVDVATWLVKQASGYYDMLNFVSAP